MSTGDLAGQRVEDWDLVGRCDVQGGDIVGAGPCMTSPPGRRSSTPGTRGRRDAVPVLASVCFLDRDPDSLRLHLLQWDADLEDALS